MTLNNNLSILPFYPVTSANPTPQECKKWWVYGHIYPLFFPGIPPFQVADYVPGSLTIIGVPPTISQGGVGTSLAIHKTIGGNPYTAYPGNVLGISPGRYYLTGTFSGQTYISDVFTIVSDVTPYLKLEWWDDQDFIMDDGVIIYNNAGGTNAYKNILYLATDLAKPSYEFEEEGENRDGYFFPIKQISYKRFRFSILAPEYICDIMRFIRLSDHIRITYRGQVYNADTFLITPNWEKEGDLASVECEFTTNTVAKKIGRLITP